MRWPLLCRGGHADAEEPAVVAASVAGAATERPARSAPTGTEPRLHAVRNATTSPPSPNTSGGVDLARLLEITRLTPAQAVGIAVDLLSALESLHTAGAGRGEFGLGAVRVGLDGRTRLTGPMRPRGSSATPAEDRPGGDLMAAGAVLTGLARAARRTVRSPDQRAAGLLRALEHAAAGAARPGADIAGLAALLRDADAAEAPTRAELAGLVAVASGRPPSPLPARVPPDNAARPAAPTGPSDGRLRVASRTVARRSWRWVLSIVVLIVVILIEFAFLRDQIIRDVRLVLDAGRSGHTTGAPAPELPPVVAPAPAAAGAVSGIDLRALDACSPGHACGVRLLIRLQPPQGEAQHVGWAFQVLDRCAATVMTVPGGTLSMPPDVLDVTAVDAVPLPPGRALAITAVTSHPAAAASPPLLVPAAGSCETSPQGPPA